MLQLIKQGVVAPKVDIDPAEDFDEETIPLVCSIFRSTIDCRIKFYIVDVLLMIFYSERQ